MTAANDRPETWQLGAYQIDGHRRELRAIRVPGERTLHIIDVLSQPRPKDGDFDERHVDEGISGLDEAQAIATDYINLAQQLGWPPMPDVWW